MTISKMYGTAVRIFKKKSEIPQNDLTKPNMEGHV